MIFDRMGTLSRDLRDLGYSRTERESPFDEDGELWTKGYELVCDQTGTVIRNDDTNKFEYRDEYTEDDEVYRYQNSGRVKLCGGYTGSYSWGRDENRFTY
jgi:hypothetical protein